MPAIYHEGSWLGNATDPEVLVKDTVGWTGKNLLKNEATTQTINGVTFTVNADKSITVNGTSSGSCQFFISIGVNLDTDKRYILSGCPINDIGAHLQHSSWVSGGEYVIDNGNGVEYNGYDAQQYPNNRVFIFIPNGKTANNLVFKPMIRRADITDPIYEPYHESVEEEIEQIYADNGVLGAKNFWSWQITNQTKNGVTWTQNTDGSVLANGATTDAQSDMYSLKFTFKKAGKYILTGKSNNVEVGLYNFQTSKWYWSNNTHPSILIDVPNTTDEWWFSVVVRTNKTVNNEIIYPMLRLASDPDDTYQPYAMTNRELTDKVFEKRTLTSADDLNNITETGIYGITTAPVNSPEATTYCTLLVKANNSNDIKQIIFEARSAGGYIYIRSYGGNAWGSWYKFTGTVVS